MPERSDGYGFVAFHPAEPPLALAEQLQMMLVVLFDGAAVADADHDGVRQARFAAARYIGNSRPSSRAEVASSRKTAFGLVSRIRANATRCCSPGDSTLAQSWPSLSRMMRCPNATSASARCSSASGDITRRARDRTRRRADRPAARTAAATGTSSRCSASGQRSVPDAYGHSWARLRSRVVLPLPDRPVITSVSPDSSRRSSGSTS